ncbi:hypothetical protein [Microbacterium sp. No. 7]|uniref:hypothetical protein n=1 Tax=Microbacterium sp. No. 7 TaxID=1714373 RepID=UPI0018D0E554|nr:hypothetical protein [Microbacterium sp. No. 7]
MPLVSSGRVVVVLQWVLAVVLPFFVFFGRGLLGAELGRIAFLGILAGWALVVLMLVPPLVTLFDREARAARTVRRAYAVSSIVLWAALVVCAIALPDAGDSGAERSALMAWTNLPASASHLIFTLVALVAAVAWVATLTTAIRGATHRHPG